MAIENYSELQAAITDWIKRSKLSGKVDSFITLAESRLKLLRIN